MTSQPSNNNARKRMSVTTVSAALVALSALGTSIAAAAYPNPLSPGPRIIGGNMTAIEQVPATVALLRRSRTELDGNLFQAQFCGGTVIAPRWVLTAAHCLLTPLGEGVTPDSVMVLAGSDDLNNPVNQPVGVSAIVSHPDYRRVEEGRDIALLYLDVEVQVTPAPINTTAVGVDEAAFIAGWGAIDTGADGLAQQFPTTLHGTFVNMSGGVNCASRYPAYRTSANATNLCAGVRQGGKDTCQGDSGGPLYRVDTAQNTAAAVAGITSWGISCGVAENPGIYTNVATYIDWIQSSIRSIDSQTTIKTNVSAALSDAADSPARQPLAPAGSDTSGIVNDGLSTNPQSGALDNANERRLGRLPSSTLIVLLLISVLRKTRR